MYYNSTEPEYVENNFLPDYLHKLSDFVDSLCNEEVQGTPIANTLFTPSYDVLEAYIIKHMKEYYNIPQDQPCKLTELLVHEEEEDDDIIKKLLLVPSDLSYEGYRELMWEITGAEAYAPVGRDEPGVNTEIQEVVAMQREEIYNRWQRLGFLGNLPEDVIENALTMQANTELFLDESEHGRTEEILGHWARFNQNLAERGLNPIVVEDIEGNTHVTWENRRELITAMDDFGLTYQTELSDIENGQLLIEEIRRLHDEPNNEGPEPIAQVGNIEFVGQNIGDATYVAGTDAVGNGDINITIGGGRFNPVRNEDTDTNVSQYDTPE